MAAPAVCPTPVDLESLKQEIECLAQSEQEELLSWQRERLRQPLGPIDLDLTERQFQVLLLVGEALQSKEIAARLGASPRTIEFHKYCIMERLRLRTTLELCRFANQNDLCEQQQEREPDMRMTRKPKSAEELSQELNAVKELERISEVCASRTLKAHREELQATEKELESALRARRRHGKES